MIFSQSSKTVIDYIAYNCEQFEYTLVRNENGVFSLKVVNLSALFSPIPKSKIKIDSIRIYKDSLLGLGQLTGLKPNDSVSLKAFNNYIDTLLLAKQLLLTCQDSIYHYYSKLDTISNLNLILKKIMVFVNTSDAAQMSLIIPFNGIEQEPFTTILKKLVQRESILSSKEPCLMSANDLDKVVLNHFFSTRNRMNLEDAEPITAKFTLLPNNINFKFFYGQNIDSLGNQKSGIRLRAEKANFEFEDGTIKNIVVTCSLMDSTGLKFHPHSFEFKNNIPISISSRSDKDYLKNINLFNYDTKPFIQSLSIHNPLNFRFVKNRLTRKSKSAYSTQKIRRVMIALGDVVMMEDVLEIDKEDYSPVNGTALMSINKPTAELRKERTSKIVDLRVYSDFEGFGEKSPNGLFQIEGAKRINVWSHRMGGSKFYWGFGTYLEPKARISKIEGQNNELVIKNQTNIEAIISRQDTSIRYLDLTEYQRYSVELNGNFLRLYMPFIKCNLQINYLASIYNTTIRDLRELGDLSENPTLKSNLLTLIEEKSEQTMLVSSFRHGIKAILEFRPEPRYAFRLDFETSKNSLLTEGVKVDVNDHNWINSFLFQGFLKTSADDSIFFRYRLTNYNLNLKDGFTQVQIGYKKDIFSRVK